jgi:PST family polysaccharide transporter
LIGRFWGSGTLGLYSRAYSLLMLPITSIRGPINAVAFPALSKLQNEPEAFRSYYLKTTSLIALLSMPLAAFFFAASKPIIELVLGEQWSGVAPIFSCLAIAALIQPASGFAGSLMLSLGKGRRYLTCGLFNAAVLSICFVVGVRWGAIGVAVAYAIGNYLILYPWLSLAFRETPVSFRDFMNTCELPLMIALAAATCGCYSQSKMTGLAPLVQCFVIGIVFVAVGGSFMVFTRRGQTMVSLIRKLRE